MSEAPVSEITQILNEWNKGEPHAEDRLLAYVYDELKRQARILMSGERHDHTLQPTALVHEAFLKLSAQADIDWKDRGHFYGITSRLMRQVLIDHARAKDTAKRGNKPIHFSMDDLQVPIGERAGSLIVLDEALDRLERIDERQAKIVEMKFFGGMDNGEIADSLGVSERTVGREWQTARLWLFRELNSSS